MKQKRAYDSHIFRAKENLKLSYGGPSQRQASNTKLQIKALRPGRHWVWDLTYRVIKEETIAAINRDRVYNQACKLNL